MIHTQLSDAPAEAEANVIDETIGGRLPPGDGVIDLLALRRILDGIGARGPTAAEVFSDELRNHPPGEGARLAVEATRAVLAAARATR